MSKQHDKVNEYIKDLLASHTPEVRELGNKINSYYHQYTDSTLSQSEFLELLSDLETVHEINKDMYEIEAWRSIRDALNTIAYIRQWIPLF
jgi:phage regulator Rha-like protein